MNKSHNKKILLITTVPETLDTILKTQPAFLSSTFDVHIVSSDGVDVVAKREKTPYSVVNMHRGISPFKDLLSIFKLVLVLIRVKPDIVHSYTPKAGLISCIASFISRVPNRIHTFTGLLFPTATGFKHYLLKIMDKLVVLLNSHIVCEGRGVWLQLTNAAFSDSKFSVIGNGNIAGVDLDYFQLAKVKNCEQSKLQFSYNLNNSKIFLYVGRINRDKGLRELVNAFLNIDGNVKLLIAGALDTTAPPDSDTLYKIGSSSNIINLGFMEDIRPIMSISNCLILPSYREGFPNVVLQAGAMELPCIVTNIPGSNEIISENVNGWIIKAKCTNSLERAMIKFLNYDELELRSVKKAARKNIKEKYERVYYQQQLLKFYEKVITNA